MKIGMYYRNSDVRVEQTSTPEIGKSDILIKVAVCGICGSDLMEWYRIKKAPLVLGHELTGEIVAVGSDIQNFKKGDRVFATHHVPCNECVYCLKGNETACHSFQNTNNFFPGGFSEFLRVSGRSVQTGILKLPQDVSFETASFIEPLGTVVRGIRTIGCRPGDTFMIFGAGLAGLLYTKLAKTLGAGNIIVTDVNEFRLETAKKMGAHHVVHPKEDVSRFIQQVNNGKLADKVVLCTGALQAAQSALTCIDRGGTLLFFAVPKPGEQLDIDFNPYWRNDISFMTSYGAAPNDNFQALHLLRTNTITVSDMITHRYSLDNIDQAFSTAGGNERALKVIVEMC